MFGNSKGTELILQSACVQFGRFAALTASRLIILSGCGKRGWFRVGRFRQSGTGYRDCEHPCC